MPHGHGAPKQPPLQPPAAQVLAQLLGPCGTSPLLGPGWREDEVPGPTAQQGHRGAAGSWMLAPPVRRPFAPKASQHGRDIGKVFQKSHGPAGRWGGGGSQLKMSLKKLQKCKHGSVKAPYPHHPCKNPVVKSGSALQLAWPWLLAGRAASGPEDPQRDTRPGHLRHPPGSCSWQRGWTGRTDTASGRAPSPPPAVTGTRMCPVLRRSQGGRGAMGTASPSASSHSDGDKQPVAPSTRAPCPGCGWPHGPSSKSIFWGGHGQGRVAL